LRIFDLHTSKARYELNVALLHLSHLLQDVYPFNLKINKKNRDPLLQTCFFICYCQPNRLFHLLSKALYNYNYTPLLIFSIRLHIDKRRRSLVSLRLEPDSLSVPNSVCSLRINTDTVIGI